MKSPFDASPFFISVTAYYALSLPEYHMPMHTHDSCEIMYVTSGGCQVYSEDGVHALTANQFIFLSANTPHRLEISAGRPCARDSKRSCRFGNCLSAAPALPHGWKQEMPA